MIRKTKNFRAPKYWVVQRDAVSGEEIARYAGLNAAEAATGVCASCISRTHKTSQYAGGFKWTYEPITYEDLEADGDTTIHNERPFKVYHDGNYIGTYDDRRLLMADTGLDPTAVSRLFSGRTQVAFGISIEFIDEED